VPNGPEFRTLQSRLALPVSILVATHLVGILGYHALWHDRGGTWMDALFMTFTTVATIGYGEVKPLDDAGRIFTMVIATAGIGTLFYTFSVGLDHLTSDSVRQSRRRRRMQQRIDGLERHFVVAGYGRVGREAAHELRQAGVPVVVVDPGTAAVRLAAEAGFLVLEGDASEDSVLEQSGVKRARALVATTANDATNLYVILSARLLNPTLFIASRAVDEASAPKLLRAGANRALSPYAIGGRRLAHLMLSPRVVDFFETAFQRGKQALRIADLQPPPSGTQRTLGALMGSGAAGVTLLAVLRGDQVVAAPEPSFALGPDDHLLALGTDEQIEALERAMSR
jgi:voltage-gated potassium channel